MEIGDAATLASCKVRNILPPQSWSNSQIAVKANVSMFAAGSKAFIYVFDSSGNVNTTGYPVTVGSFGGGGTTSSPTPNPPTNVAVQ